MGSKTMKTKTRRSLRQKNAGRKRKNMVENKGSTPKFAIHKDK